MNFDFKSEEFNSSGNSQPGISISGSYIGESVSLSKNLPFVLSIISLLFSLVILPLGFFINLSTKIISDHLSSGATYWALILLTISLVITAISLICGIFSIIAFKKTTKTNLNCIGLALAILSFLICAISIGINVVEFIILL